MDGGGELAQEELERASTTIRYLSSLRLPQQSNSQRPGPSTSSGLQGLSGGALVI